MGTEGNDGMNERIRARGDSPEQARLRGRLGFTPADDPASAGWAGLLMAAQPATARHEVPHGR